MASPLVSIITPTTGSDGLYKLIDSIAAQDVDFEHILLWDEKRHDRFSGAGQDGGGPTSPHELDADNRYSIVIKGAFVQGKAVGSALRAVGLMAARGQYVTFSDSDVWHESDHLETLLATVRGRNWGFCRRRIWRSDGVCLGVDNFESVGESEHRRVPYVLVDNNTMIFDRRLGVSAAQLYRETTQYNDDRLMTQFLYRHAGLPGLSTMATVNQVCPSRLERMFEQYCTP